MVIIAAYLFYLEFSVDELKAIRDVQHMIKLVNHLSVLMREALGGEKKSNISLVGREND